ncbi:23S rRNA (guanosine(2251)-2'-O)-methyltransferase RlmB [Faecalimonas umbilicata]|jgi:TrmH family RNA methyltransferase|uniref:23S rRNA (guanosine(2251)-2'-O)-methyltransferase RlmB n=1 Tax=Faecalimonas umbilicata TaxID=1912855 RepID=UPI0022DF2E80|nr:23S rRNA (guanosine(2251)-2'-O)-methyltransferase RlmB [Faecalimonas umbilicata]
MITSTSNARVKELVQLQKKSKVRNEQGVFLVEGVKMYQEIPQEQLVKVYVSETFADKQKEEINRLKDRRKLEYLSDHVFQYVSDTKTPQGILCVVRQTTYCLEDILEAEDAHLLVLDNLQDPGNLGTILRTAEGAGVTGIIISKESVDIYNPKVIRSTMGSIYRVPFVYVEDLKEAIAKVKAHGIFTYAAHLDGKNSYDKEDYTKKTAFLIGNEGNGLRKEIADLADTWIRIPMQGQVESLNAAIATSVLMFETARQRRNQR